MSSLVIVESPAKVKTIHKILGKEFLVMASVGHIKDLPKKEMGIDIEKDFEPVYVVIPGKEKIIKELKEASKTAKHIYLAPDPDREGEAIAYHIAVEIAGGKELNGRIFRVAFNEITDRAVKEAIKQPGKIDMKKVDAQQARRILDRLVGYKLSPLLWKKVSGRLSAGRVQSVAVRIVVEREREIESFETEEYWSIVATLEGSKTPQFQAELYKIADALIINRDAEKGQQFLVRGSASADATLDSLKQGEFILTDIEKKIRRRMPYPPFITSTLQQEASRKLGFSAKKTMLVSQQLYEGIELGKEGSHGLITYMRTDSVRVAKEAEVWARAFIEKTFGKDYVPETPPEYKVKGKAQEAHEAIRPTSERPPDSIKPFLSKDQYSLYSLIWQRFISSQMSPAVFEQTTFTIVSNSAVFRATGSVIKFKGFMAMSAEGVEDRILPQLKKGEELRLIDITPLQHFTEPPPRYTEATLVKALEEKGIGRPSTYATILSTIVDRKYADKQDGRFVPTELGVIVNDFLVEQFPELIDIRFTAKMEEELDRIESGGLKWVKVIKDFYKPFSKDLDEATKTAKVKPKDIPTDELCQMCGMPMVIKWGRHGRFMACTGYPACKNTKPIEAEKASILLTEEVCEKCGAGMVVKTGRFGKFLACSRYPECKSTKPMSTGVKCPLDNGDIVERRSKKGKPFFSCSNYPQCKFATWYKPVSLKCPQCSREFLLEKKDKSGRLIHFCYDKKCGYSMEVTQAG
ncbi:MAG: type I DNA topoisomerase [Nitrospirae bacterium]|nr:type I DNA topoisomerase [Nitrospirota bacterium]